MAKHVRLIETEVINFTELRSKKVEYGDITRLSGKNGQGKTSIGTAPVWTLYGTDLFGNKYNPSPTNYEFDRVFASTILQVDGLPIKFAREINEKGSNVFYINDVPAKAKEFEATVAELFDKDEFLSFYNPIYFFGRHWTKQREQIMKYTTPPAKKEVFQEMSRTAPEQKPKEITLNPAAAKLDELMKKHTLDDLQKIHGGTGGQKSKLEKQHISAQSRTKTLQEQLDRLPLLDRDVEEIRLDSADLLEQIKTLYEPVEAAEVTNKELNELKLQIESARARVAAAKDRYMEAFNEPIDDTCPTCNRLLDEDSVKAVTDTKESKKKLLRAEHEKLVKERNELEAKASEIQPIDLAEQWKLLREAEGKRDALEDLLAAEKNRSSLAEEVAAAKQAEADTLTSLKESVFILDAIKSYKAKEAELQASKVQSLFTSLSIRLFKYVKSNDSYEPDFSIQMNGKDYLALSTGERIEAGLELTEVLFKQSELIVPTFIDNIESYTGRVAVYDQLITGRVVDDQELKIEAEVALR
ncbi:ATPase [Paenibacillus pabuli]|uniref:ATPase n=1 Tax=Paenibacillus pabuli TaxID=1472 RepID=UPI001FFFFD64|nr:ATPase [Paenibacillus pabuli]UPK45923.1 ATPase [Paenibacillus pabuli]